MAERDEGQKTRKKGLNLCLIKVQFCVFLLYRSLRRNAKEDLNRKNQRRERLNS